MKKKKIYRISTVIFHAILCVLPLKKNRVLFLSDVRKDLGGNLKCMYDYIDGDKYEKVLCLKENRKVKRTFKEKIRMVFFIATSKYVLLDDLVYLVSIIRRRKNQEIIQLWHGPGAFKKIGSSRDSQKKIMGKNKYDKHRNYTKAICTSPNIKWCYAEGFKMEEKNIKAIGFPRTDIFFDQNYIKNKRQELYNKFPYLKNKKVILFAPTYRGNNVRKATYDFSKLNFQKIYKHLHKEYVFLIKWHHLIYENKKNFKTPLFNKNKYDSFYYDMSDIRDVNDLLLITDVLITDYSSIVFDYLLVNKPIVYFAYDLEKYTSDRGLYFPFEDYVYGPVAKNCDELISSIKSCNMMPLKRKKFKNKFMSSCDGKSTKKIYDMIFNGRQLDENFGEKGTQKN